jgi:hypothetical protein
LALHLPDTDLPAFFKDGDAAAAAGQKWTLRYTVGRLFGAVLAAVGGAISWKTDRVDIAACVIAAGFLIALVSEISAGAHQPERLWYEGRALAESAKTLAWRYVVCAEPFPESLSIAQADALIHHRLREIARAAENVPLRPEGPLLTPGMTALRRAPFEQRKEAYLSGRTDDQRRWYHGKAIFNRRASMAWRLAMVVAEIVAVFLAALRIFGGWSIDFAGILAAVIAAAAAWVGVKQYASLAAAYSTAALELTFQLHKLRGVSESEWAHVVATAENAISREHTLWLASRTGRQFLQWDDDQGSKG